MKLQFASIIERMATRVLALLCATLGLRQIWALQQQGPATAVYYGTFQEAKHLCESNGSILLGPGDVLGQEDGTLLLAVNVSTLWLNIRQSDDPGWMLTNGTRYGGNNLLREKVGTDCGSSRPKQGRYAVNCFTKINGFVCQWDDEAKCKAHACLKVGNKWISVIQMELTWFSARTACRDRGGDLATAHVNWSTSGLQNVEEAWIGVYRRGWFTEIPGKGGKLLTRFSWSTEIDHTRLTKTDRCVVMDTKERKWLPVKCDSHHYFMCSSRTLHMTTGSTESYQGSNYTTEMLIEDAVTITGPIYAALCFGVLAGFLLVLFGIILCRVKKWRGRTLTEDSRPTSEGPPNPPPVYEIYDNTTNIYDTIPGDDVTTSIYCYGASKNEVGQTNTRSELLQNRRLGSECS